MAPTNTAQDLTPTAEDLRGQILREWELSSVGTATLDLALRQLSMAERLALLLIVTAR